MRLVELLKCWRLVVVVVALVVLNGLKVLDEVRDIVVVVISSARWPLLVLLDGLVGLGKLAE